MDNIIKFPTKYNMGALVIVYPKCTIDEMTPFKATVLGCHGLYVTVIDSNEQLFDVRNEQIELAERDAA